MIFYILAFHDYTFNNKLFFIAGNVNFRKNGKANFLITFLDIPFFIIKRKYIYTN
jgi:hypothetical protein